MLFPLVFEKKFVIRHQHKDIAFSCSVMMFKILRASEFSSFLTVSASKEFKKQEHLIHQQGRDIRLLG